ncbi:chromate transporter [Bradyrhizobium hipponense]|uniref:Chromate transporter n=1 Tax=Bradyrhizobium hipponense TaxID=2605638 RepID=A0A5S4YN55_9BRAD|nr:chromate transporter [Bradyrhizobium hipponense]TYO65312.1 chromate transporter [Bradyrhizobium hipponense]
MSSNSSPAAQEPGHSAAPSLVALFLAFARMSLAGFGGVLVFARRAIVDQHRWMTPDEFNETFALRHFLPGPNIVNLSMVFGARLPGIAGGVSAFAGLLVPPTLIMTVLAIIYAKFGEMDVLRHSLAGIFCAAVGLLIAVVLRMMTPLLKKADIVGLILMLAVFAAIGVLRLRLQAVLLVAIPISVAVTFLLRRKVAA